MSGERQLIGYRVRLPNVGGGWRYISAASVYMPGASTLRKEDARLFLSRQAALRTMANLGGTWAFDGRIVHVYRRKK